MYEKIRKRMTELFPEYYKLRCDVLDDLNFEYTFEINNIEGAKYENRIEYDYFKMLIFFKDEFIDSYCYALAADMLMSKLEGSGIKDIWKKDYRDREARYLIPKYFYFKEYCSMMAYEIIAKSSEIVFKKHKEEKDFYRNRAISYNKVMKIIKKIQNNNSNINHTLKKEEIIMLKFILENLEKFDEKSYEFIENYRNIITHRYMPGIDEIIVGFNRKGFMKRIKNDNPIYSMKIGSEHTIEFFGRPEVTFNELIPIYKQMINNMNDSIKKMTELKCIRNFIIEVKETKNRE